MALVFRTDNVRVSTAAGTTFTHGLGVAPTGTNGVVRITQRTGTGVAFVVSSNSQIVVIGSSVVNADIDLEVQAYHSIIK